MINFTFPNFINSTKINDYFSYISTQKPYYLKTPIGINHISGGLPFTLWNGGVNSSLIGNLLKNEQIDNIFKTTHSSIRLNFANLFITNEDFYNNYCRLILEYGNNGSTVIEITNLNLYSYIKDNYRNYNKFILSPNAWCMKDLTPEELNAICENDDFYLISLPPYLSNNFEYIEQIQQKNKIEITVNPRCPLTCKNYQNCWLSESKKQYDFSGNSNIISCNNRLMYNNKNQVITMEDIKTKYLPKGITHFKIEECYPFSENELLLFLVHYFIKEEYQQEVIENFIMNPR